MSDQTETEETMGGATTEPEQSGREEAQGAEGTAAREGDAERDHDGELEPGVTDRQTRRYAQTRARLKEVTAERDALAGRVTAYQRAEVERIAAQHLADPSLVWANGLGLEDVLDAETEAVDTEAVEMAVRAIAERLRGALPPPAHHLDIGPKRTVPQRNSSWAGVIQGR